VTVFADSSALVKLYADEVDHRLIRQIETLVISQLARVEVPAALWRKHRMGEIAPAQAQTLCADFEADYFGADAAPPRFAAVLASQAVLDRSARLCAVHGLRAYDAVQLGCALSARDAEPSCSTFATFDGDLADAAVAEGFTLLGVS